LKPDALRAAVEDHLNATFPAGNDGKTKWIDADAFPWVYLNYRKIAKANLDNAVVAASLAEWTRKQPWAHRAYTRAEIAAIHDASDAMSRQMKKAFHAGRAGDVGLVLKEYYLSSDYETGTTHGSPWAYDTHVPLVFFGHGMPARKSAEPVTPQAIAAVFARAVGVTPAATIEATVPPEAFTR
jgi:hypothetical protein